MEKTNKLSMRLIEELAFTKEELQELERALSLPITFDEDCPETTPEKAVLFKRMNPPRKTTANHPA